MWRLASSCEKLTNSANTRFEGSRKYGCPRPQQKPLFSESPKVWKFRNVKPHPHRTRARKFERKSFDQQVPFALHRVTHPVWIGPKKVWSGQLRLRKVQKEHFETRGFHHQRECSAWRHIRFCHVIKTRGSEITWSAIHTPERFQSEQVAQEITQHTSGSKRSRDKLKSNKINCGVNTWQVNTGRGAPNSSNLTG